MAVPKQRKTKSRTNQRRMHIYLKKTFLVNCSQCGQKTRPYVVCKHCGYYKKKEVINVLAKLDKKEKKKREQEMQETQKEAPKTSMQELSKK
ncbi:MAG: 50S ribosomal protein L32 [Candidatus Pacebacteria bacterium]|nr:50S ribosomal protein L32 [Candidatus Paceibacterota bacterium]